MVYPGRAWGRGVRGRVKRYTPIFLTLDQGLKGGGVASWTPRWLLLLQKLAGSRSEAVSSAQDSIRGSKQCTRLPTSFCMQEKQWVELSLCWLLIQEELLGSQSCVLLATCQSCVLLPPVLVVQLEGGTDSLLAYQWGRSACWLCRQQRWQ